MRIIVAPAKRMREDDTLPYQHLPVFLKEAEQLKDIINGLSYADQKRAWACNERIAMATSEKFRHMNLTSALTPAVLAYDGIQYTYMAPEAFEEEQFAYCEEHLRILSGFYGVLKPFDGVTPYRLEMNARLKMAGYRSLYDFWKDKLYREVMDDSHVLVNLASQEYSKAIAPYLTEGDRMVTCIFGVWEKNKVVQKGVYAKMARGLMSRWMAERNVQDPQELKAFREEGYTYREDLSSLNEYVFLRSR